MGQSRRAFVFIYSPDAEPSHGLLVNGASDAFATPRSRLLFGALLLIAMGVATYPAAVLSVLASFLLDEFAITRAQVGLVATANTAIAAALSPAAGKLTDRIGGKTAFLVVYVGSAIGFALLGAAPAYAVLLLAALPAGIAQSAGNPSTNKLIALHLRAGRQGVMMGIKQSGVQATVFLGGVLVPLGAQTIGWRQTLFVLAALTLAVVPVVWRYVPADRPAPVAHADRDHSPLPKSIVELAAYGFLLGFGGAVTFLVPLFVEEALGGTPTLGGFAVGLVGLSAFFGRIGWARLAEQRGRYAWPLATIATGAIVASALFLASQTIGMWLVWVAAIVTGVSVSSWNSVGMLAVITEAGTDRAGRASGVVLLGFLAGLGVGPPLFGWTVDVTGSYTTMWWISIVAFALALVPLKAWGRREAASGRVVDFAHGDEIAAGAFGQLVPADEVPEARPVRGVDQMGELMGDDVVEDPGGELGDAG